MLVYGDRVRRLPPHELLDEVRSSLDRAGGFAGLERHAALVSALITGGELAQGLADAAFAADGEDRPSRDQGALARLLLELGAAVAASWRGSGAPPPDSVDLLALIDTAAWPPEIEARQPEGYAFYALYPEAYLEAAAEAPRGSPWRVVGLRSIGTSLAAVVAAALDAPPALTLRPTGDPFQRRLSISPELASEVVAGQEARFAVVDEGPGLSGSSFGAVVDFLETAGVSGDRIHLFPGHDGDLGPEASERHRLRWPRLQRHVVSTDALLVETGRLQAWVEHLAGPAVEAMQDLSGGAWRARRYREEESWPPSNTAQERRKFLLRTERGAWLARFAGLGRIGERKLQRARSLHEAGFCAEPLGLRQGFLVERWVEDSQPLRGEVAAGGGIVSRLSEYLAFRAARFPAARGASLATLFEMARVNTAEALGEKAAEQLERFRPRLQSLQAAVRPIETDSRLHAWEWLVAPEGRLLKTDALDHHAAHDLVGPQDVAWDVAGAAVEFDLDPDQAERLRRAAGAEPELLAFLRPAYLAFQLGAYAMAADAHAGQPGEEARLRSRARFYEHRLRAALT